VGIQSSIRISARQTSDGASWRQETENQTVSQKSTFMKEYGRPRQKRRGQPEEKGDPQ
jgi:hypothetical protein